MTDLDGVKLAVTVKPLAWVRPPYVDKLSRAETIVGVYRVWTHHEANGRWFWELTSSRLYGGYGATEADVMATAQADYAERILSALSPTPEAPTPIAFLKDVGGWGSDGEGYDECFVVAAKGDPGAFAVYATQQPRVDGVRVTDEMVERVTAAVKRYTQATLFVDELREVVRSALASHTPAIGETQPGLSATDETRAFPKTLGRIHEAIDGYVSALVAREHGGVAQDRAFTAICQALGRSPAEELGFRIRALANPGDGE